MQYCGLDLGKKSSRFCVVDAKRVIVREGNVRNRFMELRRAFGVPRMRIVHTSSEKEGQIYIAGVNYALMILCIAVVGGAIGLALAWLFTLRGDPTGGLFPGFYIPTADLVKGAALALAAIVPVAV
jgi:hypothetical protein